LEERTIRVSFSTTLLNSFGVFIFEQLYSLSLYINQAHQFVVVVVAVQNK
jgi:hypothetical protein